MGLDEKGYWSEREVLGYVDPALSVTYIIILSDRGRGKSYRLKQKLFKWFQNKGEMFMCIYRTTDDLADAMNDWIDIFVRDMGLSFERFSWEGNAKDGLVSLFFDGAEMGRFRALTKVNSIKHEHFPDNLVNIWWDEFIPLAWKKLPGIRSEGDALRTIIKTVDHDSVRSRTERGLKPLKVFLVANPFTWDNPVLTYFRVNPLMGYGVHRVGPGVICEMLPPISKKEGRMDADSFLGDEVNRNQGWVDQMAFISEVPSGAFPWMSVRLGSHYYGIYRSPETSIWYVRASPNHVSCRRDRQGQGRRLGSFDGLKGDEEIFDARMTKAMTDMLTRGYLRFESAGTKFQWIQDVRDIRG